MYSLLFKLFAAIASLFTKKTDSEKYIHAVSLFNKENFSEAAIIFEKIKESPQFDPQKRGEIYNYLGRCYQESGLMSEAIKAYLKSLKFNPKEAMVWTNLGTAYRADESYSKSKEAYEKALECNPEYAEAYVSISVLYSLEEDYNTALSYALKAIDLDPTLAVGYSNACVFYAHIGDIEKAEEYLSKAVKRGYHNTKVLREIIEDCRSADTDPAVKHSNEIGFLNGMQYLSNEDYATAAVIFQRTLEKGIDKQNEALMQEKLGACYVMLELYEQAITAFQEALKLDKSKNKLRIRIAHCYRHMEDYEQAMLAFNTALAMEPENAEIYHGLGATCIDAERYSDSISYYEKAISLDGKAQYYEALAVALAYCQETERAKEVLKTVSAKGSTRVSEIRYFIERIEAGNISEEDDE